LDLVGVLGAGVRTTAIGFLVSTGSGALSLVGWTLVRLTVVIGAGLLRARGND
jgi:hypothetical protein